MKTIANKELLVAADFAGFPLKEAVVEHPDKEGLENHRYRRQSRQRPEQHRPDVPPSRSARRLHDRRARV